MRTRNPITISNVLVLTLALALPIQARSMRAGFQEPTPIEAAEDAVRSLQERLIRQRQELDLQRSQQELDLTRSMRDIQRLEQEIARLSGEEAPTEDDAQDRDRRLREMQQELDRRREGLDLERGQQELDLRRGTQEIESLERELARRETQLAELQQAGQEFREQQDSRAMETRVFQLQHVDPNLLVRALSLFRAEFNSVPELKVLSVRAPADLLPAIQDLIRQLDVPVREPSVELTVQIIKASNGSEGSSLPGELAEVVEQLQRVFAYRSYELVDTVLLRGAAGQGTIAASGTMNFLPSVTSQPTFYDFNVEPTIEATDAGGERLRLNRLRLGFRIPVPSGSVSTAGEPLATNFQYVNNGINTELEILPNQQVVVGKTSVGDSAVILVMSARILN